eukprot:3533358-Rhodomonas_salina.1
MQNADSAHVDLNRDEIGAVRVWNPLGLLGLLRGLEGCELLVQEQCDASSVLTIGVVHQLWMRVKGQSKGATPD